MPDAVRSLWRYHQEIYQFHVNLHDNHPYRTNPWSWVVQGRPTSFFYEGPKRGVEGCPVAQCSKAITSIGTVSIWWLGAAAILVLAFYWLFKRDWRAGGILAGLAGGYLPWFGLEERTIYSFYTVAFEPWVIFAVVFVLAIMNTRRAEIHKRLMLLAAVSILDAAIARWFLTFLAPPGPPGPPPVPVTIAPAVVASLLLVVAMVRDWRTEGRVHPVYIYGTLALLAVKVLNWPISETAAWHSFAGGILALAQ